MRSRPSRSTLARVFAPATILAAAGIASLASAGDKEPAPVSPSVPASAASTSSPSKPARPPLDLAAPAPSATRTATFALG